MRAIIPYPLLTVSLVLMWLLLSGFTPGHLVLAVIVAMGANYALRALGEESPRFGRWAAIPELFFIVLYDIIRSNIAVAGILLSLTPRPRTSGFIQMPLRLTHPMGLAVLAVIITSTPGTAWFDYSASRRELIIHVFDLVDEEEWIALIANRYERLLLEIFE
ncbi:Na+/H+ antiporter subunit E [Chelativorans sp. Marseille-P2723]|uniref:Na+/H+ antiporter subunit E n=1 Tax=Chelativorans sp. Marseille-P2723 TaxID=2709133 RepID=UPI0015715A35|nr:Na+/H+ antiporter subunit E [Chelativorans sp. Marseille-P2723]